MDSKFIVSARKYRPSTFDSVVGQKSITTTLKNAIKNNQLAQAYLFCGPRGVGKTTCARIFAKTINCEHPTPEMEACNECNSCKAFNSNRSMNIHELDAASNNSVDDIRNLIDQVRVPPQIGKYSVYIIDEVHMLSTQAFNAFLKTLEEPPKHAIFILATTEKHKILPTILSRCQIFDFNRIKVNDIVEHLSNIAQKENIEAEPEALNIIAQKADGALRDALSFFDQIASFSGKKITYQKVIENLNVLDYEYYFKLVDNFLDANYKNTLLIFNEILNKGFDTQNFIVGLSSHFRDLLVAKDPQTITLMEIGDNIKRRYLAQSQKTSVEFLLKGLEIISKADVEHKMSQNKRLHVELMLLQISQINASQNRSVQTEKQTSQDNQGVKTKAKESSEEIEKKQQKIEQSTKTNSDTSPKTAYKGTLNVSSLLKENPEQNERQNEQKKNAKVNEKKESYKIVENLNPDDVLNKWKEYGKQFEKSSPRLYLVFLQYPVFFKDNTLTLKVMNNDQKEYFDKKLRAKVVDFINSSLHSKIDMIVKVEQFELKNKKPYTTEEKYKFLKQKNPNIDKLSKEFRLTGK